MCEACHVVMLCGQSKGKQKNEKYKNRAKFINFAEIGGICIISLGEDTPSFPFVSLSPFAPIHSSILSLPLASSLSCLKCYFLPVAEMQ